MARIAWFSPMPPARTGVARDSAELVSRLSRDHDLDLFVDEPGRAARGTRSAHDFVWLHQQRPYDLTVYQIGNSSHHDYQWPYLFRYPGLVVLHDAHLHHARAALLLRTRRFADYRDEFAWNHPDAGRDLAEIGVAGFDTHLYYSWPMTRLIVRASRLAAVHSPIVAAQLQADQPDARIATVSLGHGEAVTPERERSARERVRRRYGIPEEAVLFGCFGGLTPDKRLPQILDAFAETGAYVPRARLLLAGGSADHYDVRDDVAARGLESRVAVTGYLTSDEEFTDCIAACDVAVNLRWPTAREVSGPWLRCLAAGKPTIVVDLEHMAHVPSLDPRTWTIGGRADGGGGAPVCVAIDILDEDHSLRLAMRRLASDAELRVTVGAAGASYWREFHTPERMAAEYRRLIADAIAIEPPRAALPPHVMDGGTRVLEAVLRDIGIASPLG